MASAKRVLGKLRGSDGRIKIVTLSGVSVMVAVIALLVGVLPVFANHTEPKSKDDPQFVQYGGGSGACAFVGSAATNELHINNPATQQYSAGGVTIDLTVTGNTFSFEVLTPDVGVYDVVVNGGPHNNHYDYDDDLGQLVKADAGLHAPLKNATQTHNLSHINICWDAPTVTFTCGGEAESAVRFGDGEFTTVTAQVFTANGETDCEKSALFFVDHETPNPNVKLDFGTGEGNVSGRLDVIKEFASPDDFEALVYDGGPAEGFEILPWCEIDGNASTGAFSDVLNSGYPELPTTPTGHTACKVAEIENAAGDQHTVVYFEFEDPQFR